MAPRESWWRAGDGDPAVQLEQLRADRRWCEGLFDRARAQGGAAPPQRVVAERTHDGSGDRPRAPLGDD
ncbi:MAG TPA: hypothetical protein VF761_08845, partial [Gemmatimonadaceae bacterium]